MAEIEFRSAKKLISEFIRPFLEVGLNGILAINTVRRLENGILSVFVLLKKENVNVNIMVFDKYTEEAISFKSETSGGAASNIKEDRFKVV